MSTHSRTIAIALALLWAGQAAADYQAGVDAYNAKKFTTAMSEWMPLAEAGDPVAQNSVGALYDHGLGVEESDAEAALWYQRAAEQGLPLAMRNLGEKYLTGHGVPFDPAAAAEWLGKAAELGDPVAGQRLAAPVGQPRSAPPDPQPTAIFSDGVGTGQPQQPAAATPPGSQSLQQASVQGSGDGGGQWLIGQWQGPSLGCPPQGGLEFAPDRVLSYYQGQVSSNLPARYRALPEGVEVAVIGADGQPQTYAYHRVDATRFEIAGVPEAMPQSMIGVRFERCGPAPAAEIAQVAPAPAGDAAMEFVTAPDAAEEPLPTADAPEPDASAPSVPIESVESPPAPAATEAATAPAIEPVATGNPPQPAPSPPPAPAVTASLPAATNAAPPANSLQAGWQAFGRGDTPKAIEIWRPDADGGDVAMQLLIGSIYDYGQGVPQDDAEAIKWYRKAAAQGSAKGKFMIGAVYARSTQIPDNVKGLAWLKAAQRSLAASGKEADGDVRATQVEFLARQIAGAMSAAEIAQAEQLASTL